MKKTRIGVILANFNKLIKPSLSNKKALILFS